jgi:hypothetical protein
MIETHNEFLGNLRGQQDRSSAPHLQSHLLTDAHMIAFDMDKDLAPLLCIQSIQSLEYRGGDNISFLWDRIEHQMIDRVLLGKPFIQSRIKNFQFANEMENSVLDALKRFIPQEDLATLYQEKILSELGSLQAVRKLRDDVDVAIGFLSATCKTFLQMDGKMLLVSYMKNTMRLSADAVHVFGSNQASTVSQVVQLHHIFSLRQLLNDKLTNSGRFSSESFEKVEEQYKQKLSEEQRRNLQKMKLNFLPGELDVLLSTWKTFISHRLCGEYQTFKPNHTLKQYLQVSLNNDWFNKHFTEVDLRLAHCVDAYITLKNGEQ